MAAPEKAWFAPRRYGFGAGLPISWQGWLATGVFLGVFLTGAYGLHGEARLVVCGPSLAIFALIAAFTTRGGWRWRWGEDA